MFRFFLSLFCWFGPFFRSRHNLGLELGDLRQQVGVLKHKNPRPRLSRWDLLFWLALRRLWSRWAEVLVVVKPETVVKWHREGFRLYWRLLSRKAAVGKGDTCESWKGLEGIGWGWKRLFEYCNSLDLRCLNPTPFASGFQTHMHSICSKLREFYTVCAQTEHRETVLVSGAWTDKMPDLKPVATCVVATTCVRAQR